MGLRQSCPNLHRTHLAVRLLKPVQESQLNEKSFSPAWIPLQTSKECPMAKYCKLVYPASFSRSLQANKLVRVAYFPLKQEDTKSCFCPGVICLITVTFGLERIEASLGRYTFGKSPITDLQRVG